MKANSFDLVRVNGSPRSTMLALPPPANGSDRPTASGQEADGSAGNSRPSGSAEPRSHQADYPEPHAFKTTDVVTWDESLHPAKNYALIGHALAKCGDLYRAPRYGDGLVFASPAPKIPPTPVTAPGQLEAILVDRLLVRVLDKDGKLKGWSVPSKHLKTMLASEAFLQQFRPVDRVDTVSAYLPDFTLTRPGYNDGGYGGRILHTGEEPWIELTHAYVEKFLDVMEFASEADRTNAVAAALTVMLRNFWPGGKPCLVVTSTKSHGGKETIVVFASGTTPSTSISYEKTDWALQKAFVAAVKHNPDFGLIDVENARLQGGQREISSAYLERFLTDPQPLLFSSGTGAPVRRRNDIVVAITTNFGNISQDLMNRGLPIHLDPVGDVAARVSPIGNPKLEFLPRHRDRIAAELRGMIEVWKGEHCPLDYRVQHPFGPWAQTVGGILMVNGFSGFLGNYSMRKTADDPVRKGLGLLGAAQPGEWLRTAEWARMATNLGLADAVIPEADRNTDLGRERGMGVVLSAHRDETFHVETEDRRTELRLEKARRRFEEGRDPSTRYRFVVTKKEDIPEDMPQA